MPIAPQGSGAAIGTAPAPTNTAAISVIINTINPCPLTCLPVGERSAIYLAVVKIQRGICGQHRFFSGQTAPWNLELKKAENIQMKALWISLNLLGLTLIITGVIYTIQPRRTVYCACRCY